MIGIDHAGQGPGVFGDLVHIHDPGNIDPAVADKDPDTRLLALDRPFLRKGHLPDLGPPGLGQ